MWKSCIEQGITMQVWTSSGLYEASPKRLVVASFFFFLHNQCVYQYVCRVLCMGDFSSVQPLKRTSLIAGLCWIESTGFEPSVSALQYSTNWAMKTHTLGVHVGQFIEFIIPVKGMKHMNIMWTADIGMKWRCDHRSCDCNFIRMSAVHIIFICFIPFTGTINSINWPARNEWVFIDRLVEHCSANAEAMGSNHVETPKTFFGFTPGGGVLP